LSFGPCGSTLAERFHNSDLGSRAGVYKIHKAPLESVFDLAYRDRASMTRKHLPQTLREVVRRLLADGWIERAGKGDHRNFTKPGHPMVITVDLGVREIPIGTLRSIYRKAGWEW
jgi:predicted RNA binding protein YcfA (HicA-like mRNA interferase family)